MEIEIAPEHHFVMPEDAESYSGFQSHLEAPVPDSGFCHCLLQGIFRTFLGRKQTHLEIVAPGIIVVFPVDSYMYAINIRFEVKT